MKQECGCLLYKDEKKTDKTANQYYIHDMRKKNSAALYIRVYEDTVYRKKNRVYPHLRRDRRLTCDFWINL